MLVVIPGRCGETTFTIFLSFYSSNLFCNMRLLILRATVICLLAGKTVHAQDNLYPNEFPLSDVVRLDGPFKHARDLNIQTLLKYDVDRLLAGYRKEAGLPA